MKTIVLIPTYNEKDTIENLCKEIIQIDSNIQILVVDDNSPDGTAEIMRKLAKENNKIHLLLRLKNRGRGYAGIDGFKEALKYNPDYILEMDADYSHHPKFIQDLISKINQSDVVIGSRYVKDGKDSERNIVRGLVSTFARNYIKIVLGIKQKDPTSGYRIFKKNIIEKILPYLSANDPFIVTEILYYCNLFNFNITEIPIVFEDRKKGTSKLNTKILLKYLWKVWKLRRISTVENNDQ